MSRTFREALNEATRATADERVSEWRKRFTKHGCASRQAFNFASGKVWGVGGGAAVRVGEDTLLG
eukprot:10205213-Alexandrium_andersonii.AAC.1